MRFCRSHMDVGFEFSSVSGWQRWMWALLVDEIWILLCHMVMFVLLFKQKATLSWMIEYVLCTTLFWSLLLLIIVIIHAVNYYFVLIKQVVYLSSCGDLGLVPKSHLDLIGRVVIHYQTLVISYLNQYSSSRWDKDAMSYYRRCELSPMGYGCLFDGNNFKWKK